MTNEEIKADIDNLLGLASVLTIYSPVKISPDTYATIKALLENDATLGVLAFVVNYIQDKLAVKGAVALDLKAELMNALAAVKDQGV